MFGITAERLLNASGGSFDQPSSTQPPQADIQVNDPPTNEKAMYADNVDSRHDQVVSTAPRSEIEQNALVWAKITGFLTPLALACAGISLLGFSEPRYFMFLIGVVVYIALIRFLKNSFKSKGFIGLVIVTAIVMLLIMAVEFFTWYSIITDR
jgi:hypothetical protein